MKGNSLGSHWLSRRLRGRPSVALDDGSILTSRARLVKSEGRDHNLDTMSTADVPWTLAREHFALEQIATLKGTTTVAVIVPAKNESATIGAVLDSVLVHHELVDELVVVNDHSSDDTATVADHHGARVVHLEGAGGKGAAMGAGLEATTASIVVFLDADVLNTTSEYVARLIQPLLERPSTQLVNLALQRLRETRRILIEDAHVTKEDCGG